MKSRIITFALLLSTAGVFIECKTQPANPMGHGDSLAAGNIAATPVAQVADTTPVAQVADTAAATESGKGQQVPGGAQRVPYQGFVYVKSLIPDLIEDLRYFTTNNFMGEKADGYEANTVILSREAAEALARAADELREKGYVIKIFDAYRPQMAVDHFVRWSKSSDQRNKQDYYPNLEKKRLFPQYIATKSGHSRGSTIDMTICDKNTGEEVDMGGHFDYFGPPSHPSFTGKYPGGQVTKEHQKRRMMLRQVMVRHGFKPYDSEWWHFTLKNEPYPNTYFTFPVK